MHGGWNSRLEINFDGDTTIENVASASGLEHAIEKRKRRL
jgi:hypothetical protein